MAQAFKGKDGTLAAFVLPKFVNSEDRLYSVDDVFNGIITKTSFADTHFFVGRGAGAYPTASAVLSDISALGYNYKYEYKKIYQKEDLVLSDDVLLKVLIRHKKEDSEAVIISSPFVSKWISGISKFSFSIKKKYLEPINTKLIKFIYIWKRK